MSHNGYEYRRPNFYQRNKEEIGVLLAAFAITIRITLIVVGSMLAVAQLYPKSRLASKSNSVIPNCSATSADVKKDSIWADQWKVRCKDKRVYYCTCDETTKCAEYK